MPPQNPPQSAYPLHSSKGYLIEKNGERAGTRTPNLVIKSHLLYQLSYAPRCSTRRNYWGRRRLRGAGLALFFREIAIVSPRLEDPEHTELSNAR